MSDLLQEWQLSSGEKRVLKLAREANESDHGRHAFMGSSAYNEYSFRQSQYRAGFEQAYPGESYVMPRRYPAYVGVEAPHE